MSKQIVILLGVVLIIFSSHGTSGGRITNGEEYLISSRINSISLNGYNGPITWIPVESPKEAKVVVEKVVRGSISSALEKFSGGIRIEDHSSGSNLILMATRPNRLFGVTTSEVRFTVYASPKQIEEFHARTSNGIIKIEAEFNGLLDLKTSNGAISLRSGTGEIHLKTSNGNIDLGKLQLTNSSSIKTSNGQLSGIVSFPVAGNFSFENSNGRINLKMPYDTQGLFDISTSNGTVDFRLGRDVITKQRKVFITRGSRPSIRIKTSNGNIKIGETGWEYR